MRLQVCIAMCMLILQFSMDIAGVDLLLPLNQVGTAVAHGLASRVLPSLAYACFRCIACPRSSVSVLTIQLAQALSRLFAVLFPIRIRVSDHVKDKLD